MTRICPQVKLLCLAIVLSSSNFLRIYTPQSILPCWMWLQNASSFQRATTNVILWGKLLIAQPTQGLNIQCADYTSSSFLPPPLLLLPALTWQPSYCPPAPLLENTMDVEKKKVSSVISPHHMLGGLGGGWGLHLVGEKHRVWPSLGSQLFIEERIRSSLREAMQGLIFKGASRYNWNTLCKEINWRNGVPQ